MVKTLKTLVKIAISITILYFIYSTLDIKKFLQNLDKISVLNYIFALLFFNISQIVSAKRLEIILFVQKITMSFQDQVKMYYLGMFYNLFLPAGIGGDGYKIYYFHKSFKIKVKKLFKFLFFDRFAGLAGLVFLLFLLLFINTLNLEFYLIILMTVGVVVFFAALYYMFFKELKEVVIKVFIISVVIQALQALSAYFLFSDLTQNNILFLILFFISSIATVLPITFGGIGAREVVFLVGLSSFGINYESGILFSALFFSLTFFSSLIGLFFIRYFSKKLISL